MNEFGFNVIGYATATFGLGEVFRSYVLALDAAGFPVNVYDLDPDSSNVHANDLMRKFLVDAPDDLAYKVNLLVIPALGLNNYVANIPKGLVTRDRLNVASIWWELPVMPKSIINAASYFDAFVSGSDFVTSLLLNNVPEIPVVSAPCPMYMPEGIVADRKKFDIKENDFAVLCGFDPNSSIERKNPIAAISAFMKAFPSDDDCVLIIKTKPVNHYSSIKVRRHLATVLELAGRDPRIKVLANLISRQDLFELYRSCNVTISLHRSEGLGLMPLEAMGLGVPSVATAWSGNLSYMNYSNSCLVSSSLKPVPLASEYFGFLSTGVRNVWADASIDHASRWLVNLRSEPKLLNDLGAAAKKSYDLYCEEAREVRFASELIALYYNLNIALPKNRISIVKFALRSRNTQWRIDRLARFFKKGQ